MSLPGNKLANSASTDMTPPARGILIDYNYIAIR